MQKTNQNMWKYLIEMALIPLELPEFIESMRNRA